MTANVEIEFPPVESADEEGLLMLGGKLTQAWVLAAYRRGIFPWPLDDEATTPTAWWCPDPRAVMEFDGFHVSKRLARTMRSERFDVTFDKNFQGVIAGCAAPRDDDGGVWLTDAMQHVFVELHQADIAHSVEVWQRDDLVGGVYGLALGGYFSAESMFHRQRDASNVALASLMQRLENQGFLLVDIQVLTQHTQRLGGTEIPRTAFMERLAEALSADVLF